MLTLLAATLLGCTPPPSPVPFVETACTPESDDLYDTSGYLPQPVASLPYARTAATALALDDPRYDVGPDGVLHQPWDGHPDGVYHPVNTALYALYLVETHRATGSMAHLDRAIANGQALLAGAEVTDDGTLWFGYHFSHRLHGDDDLAMSPPWYSGMAQGQALSLFVRLHEETQDPQWQEAAHATYRSFVGEHGLGEPNFRLERDNGCLWFEEYVDDEIPATNVVNGHIYALFGLYDYARAYSDPAAVALFDAGATTVRESFDSFRLPGEVSLYCATAYCAQTRWAPESYHRGVAAQLDQLAGMTGDPVFTRMAATLRSDYVAAGATG